MEPDKEAFEQAVFRDIQARQRSRSAPRRMQAIVNELFVRRGYGRVLARAESREVWNRAVGETFAGHTCPGNVRRGVLEIFVRNSAVLQELTFRKRDLVRQLARLAPDQKIRDLKFRIGTVDPGGT
jgi:predicted nucleic acid-binding Zn ribbon protein